MDEVTPEKRRSRLMRLWSHYRSQWDRARHGPQFTVVDELPEDRGYAADVVMDGLVSEKVSFNTVRFEFEVGPTYRGINGRVYRHEAIIAVDTDGKRHEVERTVYEVFI